MKVRKSTMFLSEIIQYMYDHTLHHGRKHVCCYCLQAFQPAKKLKYHIKDCFKNNGKQTVKKPRKGEYTQFKKFERKVKSPFMMYADLESILVPEDNKKQNPNETYTNIYQKHVACSYGYKLVCVDDKFSKSFKSYLCEDPVYNFIGSIIEESKYCSDVMKKHFKQRTCTNSRIK